MDNPRIKISKAEFERYEVHYPANLVIVEMPPEKDILVAGIKINFNDEVLYAEGEGSHIADMAPVTGVVAKVVEKLYYNRKDTLRTMSWDCDCDTQKGDRVWFHHLISKNCSEIDVEGTIYKIIPFEDLFLALRGEEVIMLNGNILLSEVLVPKLSELDITTDTVDKTRGIVAYNGKDNRKYQAQGIADLSGLKKGDLVIINKGAYVFYLERNKYNSCFDGGKPYICIQKRHLDAVL